MEKWLTSVYSDGTPDFVSNPSPRRGETVAVRLRVASDAPVRHVILRSVPNGEEHLEDMHPVKTVRGLVYYEAPLLMSENRMQYQFYLVCDDAVYFYTQKEITLCVRIVVSGGRKNLW